MGTVLRSRAKDMTITIVIINPRQGWSVDDVMPGRDGPENLRILKKSQWRVEIGPWRQKFEFVPLN